MGGGGLTLRFLVAAVVAISVAQPVVASHNTSFKWASYSLSGYDNYVKWKFHSSFPTNSSFRTYVSNGRKEWNNVNRELHFAWLQAWSDPHVRVTWSDLWWPNDQFLAIANARTGWSHIDGQTRILDGEVVFNSSPKGGEKHWYGQTASPSCNQKYYDAWATAAHEFGHLVALDHSDRGADTMATNLDCGTLEKRSLTSHDKDGIKALYPANL